MSFLKKIFGKQERTQEPDYKKLIPYFQESFNLLIDFSVEQISDNNNPDSVEIGTSASAMVAAAYFVNSIVLRNRQSINRETMADEIIEKSNDFFDYISGALSKNAEREMGKRIDMDEWLATVTELQQDKVGKYIPALVNTFKKMESGGVGFDITIAIMEDLFGSSEPDIILHTKLISLLTQIKL